jgi:hypothetical protein
MSTDVAGRMPERRQRRRGDGVVMSSMTCGVAGHCTCCDVSC